MIGSNRPGAFKIHQLTIVNQDQDAINIAPITTDVKLYEGIQQQFVKGKLTVVDGIQMLKNYKLVGQESITIQVSSANSTFRKVFRIYAIDNVVGDDLKKAQSYRCNFCHERCY